MKTLELFKPQQQLYDISKPAEILLVSPPRLVELYKPLIDIAPQAAITIVDDEPGAIKKNIKGKHALIGCPRHCFDEELLSHADNLCWVHATGAGIEEFMFKSFVESNITFTNGKIIQGPECADHAIALLLALTRNIIALSRGTLPKDLPRPIEIYNKQAVIIGAGGIGLLIAERLKAFGAKITLVNPDYVPMLSYIDQVIQPSELTSALPTADFVMMAAPLTHASKKMFAADEFSAMKDSAFFINVSRGGTVDTQALTSAIKNKTILAAGIDVTDPEPLPEDHPLRTYNNVLITPHQAGLSEHNRQRSVEVVKKNIQRFVNGEPLMNIVNKSLGY